MTTLLAMTVGMLKISMKSHKRNTLSTAKKTPIQVYIKNLRSIKSLPKGDLSIHRLHCRINVSSSDISLVYPMNVSMNGYPL